jgi:hypothetical protein
LERLEESPVLLGLDRELQQGAEQLGLSDRPRQLGPEHLRRWDQFLDTHRIASRRPISWPATTIIPGAADTTPTSDRLVK